MALGDPQQHPRDHGHADPKDLADVLYLLVHSLHDLTAAFKCNVRGPEAVTQTDLQKFEDRIVRILQRHEHPFILGWSVGPVTNKKSSVSIPMDLKISNEEQVVVRLKPVSLKGKPVKIDGEPQWNVSAGTCTVEPAPDGMSATIISGGEPGDSEVVVSADADLGEGVVNISDAIRVTVAGAQAQSLGLTADAPTAKPE